MLDVLLAFGCLMTLAGWALASQRARKAENSRGVQASIALGATRQLRATLVKNRQLRSQNKALTGLRDELAAARAEAEALRAQLPPPEPELTEEQRKALWDARCAHCGGSHLRACPRVKRIRFRGDGSTPLEVEFWAAGEWPTDDVTWLEDIQPQDIQPQPQDGTVTVITG